MNSLVNHFYESILLLNPNRVLMDFMTGLLTDEGKIELKKYYDENKERIDKEAREGLEYHPQYLVMNSATYEKLKEKDAHKDNR